MSTRNSRDSVDESYWPVAKIVLLVVAALIALAVAIDAHAEIPTGFVGVVTQYGAATGSTWGPGFHWRMPGIQNAVAMDTRVQKDQSTSQAASNDLQEVNTTIAVNYNLNTTSAVNVYRTIGSDYADTVIAPAIQEVIKATTAGYTAEQLITQRPLVQATMQSGLTTRLAPYGIRVDSLNIIDFSFSPQFNAAIEQKQVASQGVLTAQQTLDQVKVNTKQQVVQAQASLDAARLSAQQQVVMAQASAKVQQLQQRSLTPLFVQHEAIAKWNGTLPTYASGGVFSALFGPVQK